MWNLQAVALLAACFSSAPAHAAQQYNIKTVCENLEGIYDCAGTFDYPSSATYRRCNGKVCGIDINYTKTKVCDAIRKQLPSADAESFISKANVICGTLAYMRQFRDAENAQLIYERGDLSAASSPILVDAVKRMDSRVRDGGITVQDSRSSNLKYELTSEGGWKYDRAIDIDLQRYLDLTNAIRPCWESSGCSPDKLSVAFEDFFNDSEGILNGQFVEILSGWMDRFDTIQTLISNVKVYVSKTQADLKKVNTKIASVRKSACVNNACKGKTASEYLSKVSKATSAVSGLKGITPKSESAYQAASDTYGIIFTASYNLRIPSTDGYVLSNLIEDGLVFDAYSLLESIETIPQMPGLINEMTSTISPIETLIKTLTQARSALSLINEILKTDWKKNKELSSTAALRKVRDGFTAIQTYTKSELRPDLVNLINNLKVLDSNLSKFPLRTKSLDWKYSAVRYRRYVYEQFNVPCVTMDTREWKSDDGKYKAVSKPFPTYESCGYGPETLWFPNAFVPYIGWRFV